MTSGYYVYNKDCVACVSEARKERSWFKTAELSIALLFVSAFILFLIVHSPTSEELTLYGNNIMRFAENHQGKIVIATLCYLAVREFSIDLSPIAIAHTCGYQFSNRVLYSCANTTVNTFEKENNKKRKI